MEHDRFMDKPAISFAVYADGRRFDETSPCLNRESVKQETIDGGQRETVTYRCKDTGLIIDHHTIQYAEEAVCECWVTVRCEGGNTIRVDRIDSIAFRLKGSDEKWDAMYYESDWGAEFEPIHKPLGEDGLLLETRYGRSSKGMHPWLTLIGENGDRITMLPMWSGNWVLRCEPDNGGDFVISGGLHDWEFFTLIHPGQSFEGVRVAVAYGHGDDLHCTSIPLARIGRAYWYPHNELSRSLPAEWNHWWSYEDKTIDEQTFRENAKEAARLGVDVCTLDAGWFGPADAEAEWYDYRGDWEKVNSVRFPSGIRALSDYVHGLGMKFGLWCEIEAVGKHSELAKLQPGFIARRNGESLGYLCFGNPDVQEWALETLDRLIGGCNCDWIKLDFNLEPQAGCSCTDHGHGPGDGLFAHYNGYYRVLDRVREKHPDILLENCASGGLRIDLGMMRHTHLTFLSDPDWPEHSLQAFWGASTMLAPDVCLHWSYSEWLGIHPSQLFNPQDEGLQPCRFDCYTRITMLHGFGLSQRLPRLPDWMRQRLAGHIGVYRDVVRPFIREADLYRLTAQPLRGDRGDRWSAFQFAMPNKGDHLLFVFRLEGAEPERSIKLAGIRADADYRLAWLSGNRTEVRSGKELMSDGINFDSLKEEDSALIRIRITE